MRRRQNHAEYHGARRLVSEDGELVLPHQRLVRVIGELPGVDGDQETEALTAAGYRRAASTRAATASSSPSVPIRPANWTAKGRPSSVRPAGRTTAG